MPRGRRPALSKEERIRLFTDHHILSVRFTKGGELSEVKHCQLGWLKPESYWAAQHIHEGMRDLAPKFIEGGYRLKAAIWQYELTLGGIEVFGTEVKIAGWEMEIGAGLVLAAIDGAQGSPPWWVVMDLLAPFLPFGEIYLILRGAMVIKGYADWVLSGGPYTTILSALKPFQGPIVVPP